MSIYVFVWLAGMLVIAGCASLIPGSPDVGEAVVEVTFANLVAEPGKYNGKLVRTEGWVSDTPYGPRLAQSIWEGVGGKYQTTPQIWLRPSAIQSRRDCEMQPGNYELCRAAVEGLFEHGGGYGRLGVYEYQISPAQGE